FLQAEGGIRHFHVTGVQTCTLPILAASLQHPALQKGTGESGPRSSLFPTEAAREQVLLPGAVTRRKRFAHLHLVEHPAHLLVVRSEERRVGEQRRCRGSPYQDSRNK